MDLFWNTWQVTQYSSNVLSVTYDLPSAYTIALILRCRLSKSLQTRALPTALQLDLGHILKLVSKMLIFIFTYLIVYVIYENITKANWYQKIMKQHTRFTCSWN